MTVRTIDMDEALELLDKQVARKGDDHKSVCFYFNETGQPQCIIGHIVADLGFTGADFTDCNSTTLDGIIKENPEGYQVENIFEGRVEFTPAALDVLCAAQSVQDGQGTWGEAVERAKARARGKYGYSK